LEPFPAGLLAGGGPRQSRANRTLIDRGRVVGLPVALGQSDEGLERRRVGLRVVDLRGW
jgi:hypothetical protein